MLTEAGIPCSFAREAGSLHFWYLHHKNLQLSSAPARCASSPTQAALQAELHSRPRRCHPQSPPQPTAALAPLAECQVASTAAGTCTCRCLACPLLAPTLPGAALPAAPILADRILKRFLTASLFQTHNLDCEHELTGLGGNNSSGAAHPCATPAGPRSLVVKFHVQRMRSDCSNRRTAGNLSTMF